MCGIVGYIGDSPKATDIIMDGLTSLEYRGYDSSGIALLDDDDIKIYRQVGPIKNLKDSIKSDKNYHDTPIAIGHTRWATHGRPSVANAHPQFNKHESIMVVHNGIIENYQEIKDQLTALGYEFSSETDTEVIPNLIDYYYMKLGSFEQAVISTLKDLKGAYALAIISSLDPKKLYSAKLSSPLVIGLAEHGTIVASDPIAFANHTKKVIYLDDFELAIINSDQSYRLVNFKEFKPITKQAELLNFDSLSAKLGKFPDFMLKEIHDIPSTIRATTQGRINLHDSSIKLGGLEQVENQLKHIDRITIVACGTSYYAGLIGEYLIEEIANIPVEVQLASEFKYRKEPLSRSTALLAISQSGETADTISALNKVDDFGILKLGIVNAVGSTISRLTDAGIYCHAGPEQSVASTKAFASQVVVLSLLALYLSNGTSKLYKPLLHELSQLASKTEQVLASSQDITKIAKKYAKYSNFLYIGRDYGYPCALEGALKLKEISYIHAEGYASGEMKHGPLAMIDQSFPSFAIATDSPLLNKNISNIEEIKARSGPIIAIATSGNKKVKNLANSTIYIPKCAEQLQPILTVLVMQLFAYSVAVSKKLNVDRPRNLAKSVTVE